MSGTPRKHRGKLNSKAAINSIVIESQPYYFYGGSADIIPYGIDNVYPERILHAIKNSPTAKGCVKRLREFVFGQGLVSGGGTIVNREGETLNDITKQSVKDYADLNAFALHFNFNLLGQVVEIFNIPVQYIRKHRELDKVDIGVWDTRSRLYSNEFITIDMFGLSNPIDKMLDGGYVGYKGQVMYFVNDNQIYADSLLDGSTLSAEYEREAQIYPYANIKNGFSASAIIKLPTLPAKAEERVDSMESELSKLHGAENAGGIIVTPVTIGDSGDPKDFKMVEFLVPPGVDDLFVNQNEGAQGNLLKTYTMPLALLGVTDSGMFNQASFNDAFNYKNADTEADRKIIEREFNKFLSNSTFGIDEIEILPLAMKGESGVIEPVGSDVIQEGETPISQEQLAAQAALKGSVGGVQGILGVQQGVSSGTTTFSAGLAILKLIYGFTDKEAIQLLGDPETGEETTQPPTL